MRVNITAIEGVLLLTPQVFTDARGSFQESYNRRAFAAATGVDPTFVQDNHSRSVRGVLRGLHYQVRQPQGKLVGVARGRIFDVAVDLRRASPTFGRWAGAVLSARNHRQMWLPVGCAHGYLVLSAQADVLYKTTDYYAPEQERCIAWDDPDLAVDWPLREAGAAAPLLSTRDAAGGHFAGAELPVPSAVRDPRSA